MKSLSWGWRIIILYVIFIAGTVGWVTYAMTKEVDLVRSDYYEHGLDHDKTMAARVRAEALSPKASIEYDHATDMLRVQIPSEQVTVATGSIWLYRPNTSSSDRVITLAFGPDGKMLIPGQQLARGLWQFTCDWKANGVSYELIKSDTL